MVAAQNMHITVVDPDASRRKAIARLLASLVECVDQWDELRPLPDSWGPATHILVHDGAGRVTRLQSELEARCKWYSHVAFGNIGDSVDVVDAVLGGAVDYLTWPFTSQELLPRLRLWPARSSEIALRLNRRTASRSRLRKLTPRQREVIALVACGETDRTMAELLGIGKRTVEIHRLAAYKNLGARNAAAATRIAVEGEISLPDLD